MRTASAPHADAIAAILASGDVALILRRPSLRQALVAIRRGWHLGGVARLTPHRRERLARVLDSEGTRRAVCVEIRIGRAGLQPVGGAHPTLH